MSGIALAIDIIRIILYQSSFINVNIFIINQQPFRFIFLLLSNCGSGLSTAAKVVRLVFPPKFADKFKQIYKKSTNFRFIFAVIILK